MHCLQLSRERGYNTRGAVGYSCQLCQALAESRCLAVVKFVSDWKEEEEAVQKRGLKRIFYIGSAEHENPYILQVCNSSAHH